MSLYQEPSRKTLGDPGVRVGHAWTRVLCFNTENSFVSMTLDCCSEISLANIQNSLESADRFLSVSQSWGNLLGTRILRLSFLLFFTDTVIYSLFLLFLIFKSWGQGSPHRRHTGFESSNGFQKICGTTTKWQKSCPQFPQDWKSCFLSRIPGGMRKLSLTLNTVSMES